MIVTQVMEGKILVIDDELGPRESLRILLKNEYEVFLADGVDVGLEILAAESPDLVIMDIRMPGKTGIEGLKEIRDIDAEIAVVMLTGFGALETAQEAMRYGANDYLRKPFDTEDLRRVIKTNLQRTQVARRRAHVAEELRALNSDLVNELTLKEHMATLGHASSEFMHDLRNPLTVVHGYTQLLEEQLEVLNEKMGEDGQEALSYLNIISRNIDRCYEITEMWRNLGKDDEGAGESVQVADLLKDVVRSAEPVAVSAGTTLELSICEDAGAIQGHPVHLFRALQNLVNNAIHAVPTGKGVVRVVCENEGDSITTSIIDNGEGMSEKKIAKIFEPYYTTKESGEGTGLGLAITKKVIESHGGSIRVASVEGSGSTFVVNLPRQAPDA